MDGLGKYYAKWNNSDRERQTLYDITYMWNLKINTNESRYKTNRFTDTENKLSYQSGGGTNQEYRINRYKLLYIN